MKALHLTIKNQLLIQDNVFNMIKYGERNEYYTEINPYWDSRILGKVFDTVILKNWHLNNCETLTVECLAIEVGKPKPEWSDNWQGVVFIIKLGKIL